MDTINSWHNGCGRPVIVKEEISKIASECMEACTCEGRKFGSIELISDRQLVHVCIYISHPLCLSL